jgi:hypothetical protein
MFSFYMKKTFVDMVPGIELVNIHYTWTPLGELPNWQSLRETRAMPRGGVLVRGMGGTTLDESGQPVQTQSETIQLPDDGVRRKIIKLPNEIEDPATGKYADNYLFHHYFEIFRNGKRELTPLYTEEIVSKEVEYVDYQAISVECVSTGASTTGTRRNISRPKSRPSLRATAKTVPTDRSSSTVPRRRRISHVLVRRC